MRRVRVSQPSVHPCALSRWRVGPHEPPSSWSACRSLAVTPRVAQNTSNRSSAFDGRTARHDGYGTSQRKWIEEIFGWLKTIGLLRKTRHRGARRVEWIFPFGLAAYNVIRIRNLAGQTA